MNVPGRKKGMFCGRNMGSSTDGRCSLHRAMCSASRHVNEPIFSGAMLDSPHSGLLQGVGGGDAGVDDKHRAELKFVKELRTQKYARLGSSAWMLASSREL